jgi:hypothetical protein
MYENEYLRERARAWQDGSIECCGECKYYPSQCVGGFIIHGDCLDRVRREG